MTNVLSNYVQTLVDVDAPYIGNNNLPVEAQLTILRFSRPFT